MEPGYLNDVGKFSTLNSALAVPLESLDGVVGVLTLYNATKDAFTRDHLRILLAQDKSNTQAQKMARECDARLKSVKSPVLSPSQEPLLER